MRQDNARAQAVYASLGFQRFDPEGEESRRYDGVAEAPMDACFRMRLPGHRHQRNTQRRFTR